MIDFIFGSQGAILEQLIVVLMSVFVHGGYWNTSAEYNTRRWVEETLWKQLPNRYFIPDLREGKMTFPF